MIRLLLFLVLCTASLDALQLQNRLSTAQPGDFIVYAHKSHCTLVRIAKITDKELVIQEVSAPLPDTLPDWNKWLQEKAPGHTSWTSSVIDRQTGKVISSDDDAQQNIQFLPTLMKLTLIPMPLDERKKIGPEPQAGEVDHRRIWNPKIIFNGKELSCQIQAYRIQWPDDASELAGRVIDVYIPENEALTYLPYWIEVYSGPLKLKIFAIDSGKKLSTK